MHVTKRGSLTYAISHSEEGARFPASAVASGVWADAVPLKQAHDLQEVGSGTATMREELQKIGYLGDVPASYKHSPLHGHFELHIGKTFHISGSNYSCSANVIQEQGPILEARNRRIGVVIGAQAFRWHTITIRGLESHTGATTFPYRSDAMLTAAKMIVRSHVRATELSCLASTGVLTLKPGSTNTVPGEVKFSLDIRSGSDDQLMILEESLRQDFELIARDELLEGETQKGTKGKGCTIQWKLDASSKATRFNDSCIQCIRDSATGMADLEGTSFDSIAIDKMISGAVHDR